jgi:hypothetical protein
LRHLSKSFTGVMPICRTHRGKVKSNRARNANRYGMLPNAILFSPYIIK